MTGTGIIHRHVESRNQAQPEFQRLEIVSKESKKYSVKTRSPGEKKNYKKKNTM